MTNFLNRNQNTFRILATVVVTVVSIKAVVKIVTN
jgi:hypothetical protein